MIVLGQLQTQETSSVLATRAKVLQVARILLGDEVKAVRIASAISTCFRELEPHGEHAPVQVVLREQGSKIALSFRWPVDSGSKIGRRLSAFLDVEHDETDALWASCALPLSRAKASGHVPALREILERKGRDELLADLRESNQQLRDSLENLRRTRSAKERMESELNIGREIQMSMLPLDFPIHPERTEFDAYAALQPAREVGGDFYDFFLVDDNHFCFSVGDVSGKGVPSALFMAVTKTLIKSRASNDLSPASILSHVNSELSKNNESCMFVTIFLAIVDLESGRLIYCNAGHNPPYIRRRDGTLERLSNRHGPVVGAVEGIAFGEEETVLGADDLVLLYTDGVTEAADPDYNLYSEDRLFSVFRGLLDCEVEPAIAAVLHDVEKFRKEAEPSDDITVLGVRFTGTTSESADRKLKVTIRNDLEQIGTVNAAFDEFCGRLDIDKPIRRKMNLVFDELLSNVINYAYSDDAHHEIDVRVSLVGPSLTVTITDDGDPFNPFEEKEPDTSLSVEARPIGGLGVHLVKNLVENAKYERRGERNVVTLSKELI